MAEQQPQAELRTLSAEELREWRLRPDRVERIFFVLMGLGSALCIFLAMSIEPDPRGFGTHEQLGLAPCGMLETVGVPCPSCGMTTSWSLAAHGRVWDAVRNQPCGAALFFVAIGLLPLSLYVLSGRFSAFNWLLEHRALAWAVGFLVFFVLSWIYKIWITV